MVVKTYILLKFISISLNVALITFIYNYLKHLTLRCNSTAGSVSSLVPLYWEKLCPRS